MIEGLASCLIQGLWNGSDPYSKDWPPQLATSFLTMPLPPKMSVNCASTIFGHVSMVMSGGCLFFKYKYLCNALDTISFLGVSPNKVYRQSIKIQYAKGKNRYCCFLCFQENSNRLKSWCQTILTIHKQINTGYPFLDI